MNPTQSQLMPAVPASLTWPVLGASPPVSPTLSLDVPPAEPVCVPAPTPLPADTRLDDLLALAHHSRTLSHNLPRPRRGSTLR